MVWWKEKLLEKPFWLPSVGWACHIAEEVSGSIHDALIIGSDFTPDKNYLSL